MFVIFKRDKIKDIYIFLLKNYSVVLLVVFIFYHRLSFLINFVLFICYICQVRLIPKTCTI